MSEGLKAQDLVVPEEPLGIWPSACSNGSVRPEILMNERELLVCTALSVGDKLTVGAERLSRLCRDGMGVVEKILPDLTLSDFVVILAIVENSAKLEARHRLQWKAATHESLTIE